MKFEEFINKDEPAYEVYKMISDIVFDEGDRNSEFLERISPEARIVYQVWNLDGEIHNGGFNQLFVNSLGEHCDEVLSYLESLEATNSERLLKAAMSYFPNSQVPKDRQARVDVWLPISEDHKVQEALEALDQEFYEYKDNLVGILDNYVTSNKNAEIKA